jgi:hypothetical protein
MTQLTLVVGILVLAVCSLSTQTSFAEPMKSHCSGVLHLVNGELRFGGGRGESEGICIVSHAEVGKVLTTCRVDNRCTVEGIVDYCKDSGECVDIKNITAVHKR